ncbi:MAG TPA: winged helix-turn-helix transcriptional regulator [Paracoccaceae bacterium]|nr:winged helix-turn-helix transcriptional regulator [Paracoccaceae bacterium]
MNGNSSHGSGNGNGARSGTQTLTLLALPLNVSILRAIAAKPQLQADLRRETGSPPQTTLRAQLKRLAEIGAISKERRNSFPGILAYELTEAGRDLLFVIDVLEGWLALAPSGPLRFGDNAARAAVKALVEGWSTKMLRVLAARPLSLTELDRVIGDLSYPSLERRLGAMRIVNQVEACQGNGRGTPYAVTDWARQGVAPLVAAARWERRHLAEETRAIGRHDIEAALLLSVPLVRLPAGVSGSCRMGVEFANSAGRRLVGAMVEMDNGRVASCTTQLQGHPDAWALGSSRAWMNAVLTADTSRLELGGDCVFARSLLEGLHAALLPDPVGAAGELS